MWFVCQSEDTFESFPTQDAEGAESDNFLLTGGKFSVTRHEIIPLVIKSARICMLAHGEDLVDELEFLAKKVSKMPSPGIEPGCLDSRVADV